MNSPKPVVILATSADLTALEHDLRSTKRRPIRGFSVQVDGLDPNRALAAQKAINAGYFACGCAEGTALSVIGAGLGTAWALGPAHLSGLAIAGAGLAGFLAGLVLGKAAGLWWARRRMAEAVAQLRHHLGPAERGDDHVSGPEPEPCHPHAARSQSRASSLCPSPAQ